MGYHTQKSTSSGTVIALVLILGFVLLVGAFVVGVGGYLFLRNTRMQQALMARERAELARAQAREMQARVERVQSAAEAEFQRVQGIIASQQAALESSIGREPTAVHSITILLDQDGNMQIDRESIDPDVLRTKLKEAINNGGSPPPVEIQVDKRCLFEHVAQVLSVCREMKVSDVNVSAREE